MSEARELTSSERLALAARAIANMAGPSSEWVGDARRMLHELLGELERSELANAELRACVAKQDAAVPSRDEVNRVANLLIAEWERIERKKVNVSYVSNFADMARVVISDRKAKCDASETEAATTLATAQRQIYSAELERDSLRQQLEAAQRELASVREVAVSVNRIAEKRGAERDVAQADLAAAQRRIGELDHALDLRTKERDAKVDSMVELCADIDRAQQHGNDMCSTIERANAKIDTITAVIRIIAPAYRAAEAYCDDHYHIGGRGELEMATHEARAALTPAMISMMEPSKP